jgi:hypothetical protein
MKSVLRSKVFWLSVFFLVVGLVSRCVFDTSGLAVGLYISSAAPPHACLGEAYSFEFEARNGTKPYAWSISSGTKPPGLNLDTSTGVLQGTPTQNGNFVFWVQVKDKAGANYKEECTISVWDLNITNSDSVITYCPGLSFDYEIHACGGTPPLTWSVSAGSLPSGVTLVSGQVKGTISGTGTYSFTVTVQDSVGQTADHAFTLEPASGVHISSAATLPHGQTSVSYAPYTLEACGGASPYAWTEPDGDIPAGLSLGPGGIISGTPTKSGDSSFRVVVKDSSSPPGSDEKYFSLSVAPSPLSITAASPLTDATECQSYSTTLTASGGTGTYNWSAGQMPPGLTISTLGVISGVPTQPSSTAYSFSVQVSDGSTTASKTFSLKVLEQSAVTPDLIVPEIRHAAALGYNVISLTAIPDVKVDFRFTTTSYLPLATTPATLQVLGACSTISATSLSGQQSVNGLTVRVAHFDPGPVAVLLQAAGQKAGDSVQLRFKVTVTIDTKTETFVQLVTATVSQ